MSSRWAYNSVAAAVRVHRVQKHSSPCLQVITCLSKANSAPNSTEQIAAFSTAAKVSSATQQRLSPGSPQPKVAALQELGLSKAEILQLVNLKPTAEVELYVVSSRSRCFSIRIMSDQHQLQVIKDLDDRLPNQAEALLELIKQHLLID